MRAKGDPFFPILGLKGEPISRKSQAGVLVPGVVSWKGLGNPVCVRKGILSFPAWDWKVPISHKSQAGVLVPGVVSWKGLGNP